MGLLWYYLRRFVRTNFAPIPQHVAYRWNRRLRIIYTIVAWNIAGFSIYYVFSKKKEQDQPNMPSSIYYAKNLQLGNTKVIRMSGLNVDVKNFTEDEINQQYDIYTKQIEQASKKKDHVEV